MIAAVAYQSICQQRRCLFEAGVPLVGRLARKKTTIGYMYAIHSVLNIDFIFVIYILQRESIQQQDYVNIIFSVYHQCHCLCGEKEAWMQEYNLNQGHL